jgi:putative transposase
MIEVEHPTLRVVKQCGLPGLNCSSLYYVPVAESDENLRILRWLDEQYM